MGQETAVKLTMSLLCSGRAEETKKVLNHFQKYERVLARKFWL